MCEQSWSLAVLQLLKAPLSSDPLRNLVNAECVFSDDLGIFYPDDLPNSVAKILWWRPGFYRHFFPAWFSAALTGSLSHLLQQMEQELSGYSFHHLAAFIHPLIRSCLHADKK